MGRNYPSPIMQSTLAEARLASSTDSVVLLTGETGSGKDYIARSIHDDSKRCNGPFVCINCAAIPLELAESELFGHESGAFTGNNGRKRGQLRLAEGGTLLLNEVGELSPPVQAKLLTFLDTGTFIPVGGEKSVSVNTRIIAATNRDLEEEVEAKRFRADLFYRLDVFRILIPPLRQRRADIPLLIGEILSKLGADLNIASKKVGPKDMESLLSHHWPGNVRELRNVLERALITSNGTLNLDSFLRRRTDQTWRYEVSFPEEDNQCLADVINDVRRAVLVESLRRTGGVKQRTVKMLGISRHSLYHYMRTYGIDAEKTDTQSG